jgi:zona occludens toxin (predicted ATPase)
LGRPRSRSRLRNERFASYLSANNRRSIDTDAQDALLAGRKVARGLLSLAALALAAWVVLESALAVGIF